MFCHSARCCCTGAGAGVPPPTGRDSPPAGSVAAALTVGPAQRRRDGRAPRTSPTIDCSEHAAAGEPRRRRRRRPGTAADRHHPPGNRRSKGAGTAGEPLSPDSRGVTAAGQPGSYCHRTAGQPGSYCHRTAGQPGSHCRRTVTATGQPGSHCRRTAGELLPPDSRDDRVTSDRQSGLPYRLRQPGTHTAHTPARAAAQDWSGGYRYRRCARLGRLPTYWADTDRLTEAR